MAMALRTDGGRCGPSNDVDGEDIYNCIICMEDMLTRQPRTLRCNHTFCTECIQNIIRSNDDSNDVSCPNCRMVTPVSSGDVKTLPLNFTLQRMRDREDMLSRQRAAADATIQAVYCEVCKKGEPVSKCEECKRKMCETCHQNHLKVPSYAQHKVIMLCTVHRTSINVVCHRCIKALCAVCVLLDHTDHAEETEQLEDGIMKMRTQGEELIQTINGEFDRFKQHASNVADKLQKTQYLQEELGRRTTQFEVIVAEVKDRIKEIEDTCQKPAETLNEIFLFTLIDINEMLDMLLARQTLPDVEFVSKFKDSKDKAENSISLIENLLAEDCDEANVELAPEGSGHILKPPIVTPEMELVTPEMELVDNSVLGAGSVETFDHPNMVLALKNIDNLSLKSPEQIEFLDDNLVAVVDWLLPYVCMLDQEGDVVAKCYGKEKRQPLKGFQLQGNSMYLVQPNVITKINISFPPKEPVSTMNPDIAKMSKIVYIEEEKWIIASFHGKCIYEYNAKDGAKKVLAENLEGPSHISLFQDKTGTKFIVTMRSGHFIAVFDNNWNKVSQLGKEGNQDGELQWPGGTAVTSDGVVMVTDWKNNRISKFSLDGRFLGHLMTEKDGIRAPMGITLKYPKMWITEQAENHACIKSFTFE